MPDDPSDRRLHWEGVWASRLPEEVSWYQPVPRVSLEVITRLADPTAAVVDVGGGASRLTDGLLDAGYSDLTLLDISTPALSAARERLGDRAARVNWVVADLADWDPPRRFDLWHDRAVFHFLVDDADRDGYLGCLRSAVASSGHAVIATFAPDGPEMCSGLPVRRYSSEAMTDALGAEFEAIEFIEETHETPSGARQEFLYGIFRKV